MPWITAMRRGRSEGAGRVRRHPLPAAEGRGEWTRWTRPTPLRRGLLVCGAGRRRGGVGGDGGAVATRPCCRSSARNSKHLRRRHRHRGRPGPAAPRWTSALTAARWIGLWRGSPPGRTRATRARSWCATSTSSSPPSKPVTRWRCSTSRRARLRTATSSEFQRSTPLWGLVALFAVAVIAFGRWQGVRALAGLAASALIWWPSWSPPSCVTKPAVLVADRDGRDRPGGALPRPRLEHRHHRGGGGHAGQPGGDRRARRCCRFVDPADGPRRRAGPGPAGHRHSLDLRGLLVAGIVVGAVGVLDDVTVTQVSTVVALRRASPRRRPPSCTATPCVWAGTTSRPR